MDPADLAGRLGISKAWYYDLETDDQCHELRYTLDLRQLFHLCELIGMSPGEFYDGEGRDGRGRAGGMSELVAALVAERRQRGQSQEEAESETGWFFADMLQSPGLLLSNCTDCVRDLCKYVGWDWLGCLEVWFDHWRASPLR